MRTIPLTKGLQAIVDDEDYPHLITYKWHVNKGRRGGCYAVRYVRRGVHEAMHRALLDVPDHIRVDHINGNTLDNRRSNLRLATHAQNCYNQQKNKGGGTSQYKGVYWNQERRKWIAQIRHKRIIYLGAYETEDQAARAYDTAAREHFGEFARPNFTELIKE